MRGATSIGSSDGLCHPTVRRPVVDMMLVIDSTRAGASTAMVWTIMPPIETPATCAASMPRWSSRARPSPAMSSREYGARARPVVKARTSWVRRTRARTFVERPVSRLS